MGKCNSITNLKRISSQEMGVLGYPGLPMRISNKVWQWKSLEGFIMLRRDESMLHDDEFSFLLSSIFLVDFKEIFI
jgi:hypothetical protein